MGRAPLRHSSAHHPLGRRLLGPTSYRLDPCHPVCGRCHSLEPQESEEPLLLATYLDKRGTRQEQFHRTLLWPRLSVLSLATSASLWLVGHRTAGCLDIYRFHHRWSRC